MRFICFLAGSGSLIGIMLLVRAILRSRIPPGILYVLWLLPAVRLLLPFTLIPVPILPEMAGEVLTLDGNAIGVVADNINIAETAWEAELAGTGGVTEAFSPAESRADIQEKAKTERMMYRQRMGMLSCLRCIWLSGSLFCGGYVILINLRLKRSIKQMRQLPEKRLVPVYIRSEAVSPCLFGFFHPCILLSEQTAKNRELRRQALLHEETHYRQKDYIWTVLRIFLCVIYWWNPLVWLGAACAREDAEFACDARALRGATLPEKKAYGYALLEIVQGVQSARTLVQGITSVSGKGKNMKRRLEGIISENKRAGVWPLPVCLLLLAFLCGLCFPAQKVRAEEEVGREPDVESGDEIKRVEADEAEPEKKENSTDTASQIMDSGAGNAQKDQEEEEKAETGIRLYPSERREGYREPELSYTASAGWLTDISGSGGELERIEGLARRALGELYDLTGFQVKECFYGYNEIGMLFFSQSEEDMKHSRVFYTYNMGEKDGYDNIPSIDIVNARRVWYSDVQQLAIPENVESMEKEALAVWFLEHSPLCPDGWVVQIEPVSERGPDCLKLTMEDGAIYEIDMDMEILAINNIYGPYPEDFQH